MPEIRCPNCGRNNPDLLDLCQFCQAPLKPESILHSGEKPTKKHTGDLESVLPDWLRDVREKAKDSSEDIAQTSTSFSSQKNEPPDLLAGLASQAGSAEEDDIPDWLASIQPEAKPSSSPARESGSDFFTQFDQNDSKPEPPQEDVPSWTSDINNPSTAPADKDELSAWFAQASGQPEETVELDDEQSDTGWGSAFAPSAGTSAPKEEEDLSWLHNLEADAKQTGDLQTPKREMDWTADFQPSSSSSAAQDDLSWLDRLGGIEEPSKPAAEQPAAQSDDLSWLNQFGGTPETPPPSQHAPSREDLGWLNNFESVSESEAVDAAPDQPVQPSPFATGEDLNWLNTLGVPSEPSPSSQPFNVSEEKQTSEEDLSWLNNLGKTPEPTNAPQATSREDLSWLNDLGGASDPFTAPPFESDRESQELPPTPALPLGEKTVEEEPDWLKSAAEDRSMPSLRDLSTDWFAGTTLPEQEKVPPAAPPAAPFEGDIFATPAEPASLSNQDVDSLFSVDMPDWLSRPEAETAEPVAPQASAAPEGEGESLAPVDLPSWVQAMRPVEAVITETTPSVSDQPAETEGPLAGLHGVIPIAPAGSSRRPRPVSLTLQASDEQQASAILLEQILGTETSPRTLVSAPVVTSQQWLRWALSGVFLLVLSAVIFLRSQLIPVSANLPEHVGGLSNTVMSIPANAKVLVVIDYEPSLAGEMEAVAGPLLDQVVLLSQPSLSFVSTSPNGAALVERLMVNTNIRQAGAQYLNLGYLPGGSAGVLGFIEAPGQIIPLAGVQSFAEYSALVVLTDHAESGRVWVEQLQNRKTADLSLTNQPLLMVASAQAGPLLQPYVSSRQISGMISGLSDAARYEFVNNSRPGIARSYWDTFGIGLMMSVVLILAGSLWSLFTGMRARRTNAESG